MKMEDYYNETYIRYVNKIISVAKEAVDRQGLIAILTMSIGNDDENRRNGTR